jgi:hypothetical protein
MYNAAMFRCMARFVGATLVVARSKERSNLLRFHIVQGKMDGDE